MLGIYNTKGRAQEYCESAVNLYRGCSHGCKYCYAPAATHQERAQFDAPAPRAGILEQIQRDAKRLSDGAWECLPRPVLLCFTCDPYQPMEAEYKFTRSAIARLKHYGIPVKILTKGAVLARRDFDLLGRGDEFGVTLTFDNGEDSLEWEPGADEPIDRIASLRLAHERGLQTWVSCEPVLDSEQTLWLIEFTAPFVDKFMVGKWNHDKRADAIDWRKFGLQAEALLKSIGKDYYIKQDLREAMR